MCGIAGIISSSPFPACTERLQKMADALAHRGPDGEGFWINKDQTAGFAHRRLSVIDLSNAASQPMGYPSAPHSTTGRRYTITYNGCIYNYTEIKDILKSKGYVFHTHSDTEVILAAYDCYQEDCLQHFDGMFSFAIWDETTHTFFAARDRFGEKPFFYFFNETDHSFHFASEMKSLWAAGIAKSADEEALLCFIGIGLTQFPLEKQRTFYHKICSLPPAHYIKWQTDNHIQIIRYWDIDKNHIIPRSEKEATDTFRSLFFNSVKRRLRGDVAIGATLSGGLDSSSIASAINKHEGGSCTHPFFSAVFPGFEKDESVFIQEVVSAYQLKNFTVSPTHYSLIDTLEDLCYHHEQPISSSSVFVQYAVYQLAKQHGIKVLLDGQGADETTAGYPKYIHWWLQELIGHGKWSQFRKEKRSLNHNGTDYNWDYKNYLAAFMPGVTSKLLQNRENKRLNINADIDPGFLQAYNSRNISYKPRITGLNDILYYNTMQSGLDELLSYADRNSMSHGIEVRLPFLNHELVEFIFSLPGKFKIHEGYTKWILREAMKEELPAAIIRRTDKIGFEPPQQHWMQQPALQDHIRDARQQLVTAGILKKTVLKTPVYSQPAYSKDNNNWRYLIAATLLRLV